MACIAIQVYTGQEFAVSRKLSQKTGLSFINPARRKLTIRQDGSTSIGFVDVLKGYVLAVLPELSAELWHQIMDTFGVIRILDGKVTDEELSRITKELYPVIEISENTNIEEREERILRKTAIGNIIQRIRRNKIITTFPAKLLNKALSVQAQYSGRIMDVSVNVVKKLIRLIS